MTRPLLTVCACTLTCLLCVATELSPKATAVPDYAARQLRTGALKGRTAHVAQVGEQAREPEEHHRVGALRSRVGTGLRSRPPASGAASQHGGTPVTSSAGSGFLTPSLGSPAGYQAASDGSLAADASTSPPGDEFWIHRRGSATLYQAPVGGLSNRLRSIATVLTLAKSHPDWNVRIMFDNNNGAYWNEYFSAPRLGPGPHGDYNLLGGGRNLSEARCQTEWTVMEYPPAHLFNLTRAEQVGGETVQCTQTWGMWLLQWPEAVQWFYRSLRPSAEVQRLMDDWKARNKWGQYDWVGVHVRRTDHLPKMKSQTGRMKLNATCAAAVASMTVDELFPLSKYVDRMRAVLALRDGKLGQTVTERAKMRPLRFFLASDDFKAEEDIKAAFPKGYVRSFVKTKVDDSQADVSTNRYTSLGQQEALADMLLLASTRFFIGTQKSTFSGTVKWIGEMMYTEVGVERPC